jgi:hypothetical protein
MTMLQIDAAHDATPLGGETPAWAQEGQWVFLLTCYMLGGPEGQNLGAPGYSHDFVARLFRPILERWGEVIEVRDAPRSLQASVDECRRQGKKPIHFSVLPFQDVCLVKDAPNIVMPAWEYPDVPSESFDGNPQNDWPATADRCDLCLVSGPFTAAALRRGGATVPIRIVPVPTPAGYFALPARTVAETRKVACRGYVFPQSGDEAADASAPAAAPRTQRIGKAIELAFRRTLQATLGQTAYERLSRLTQGLKPARRRQPVFDLPYPRVEELELSGVVFTSIFNPDDGRKNWLDLLTGYLSALADREDATLVVKLIARREKSVRKVIDAYRRCGISHRCRIVFICDFLSDEQMLSLCRATTFYVQATRAEGNCLPLMNYLAAGRPGISPAHSSMGDYFGDRAGLVVASHPEPAAWPHDQRLRLRTSWGRIVWTSLRDQIQAGYRMATEQPESYGSLSATCRADMRAWASYPSVSRRLEAALAEMVGRRPAGQRRAAAARPLTAADFAVQSWAAGPLNRSNRHGTANDARPQGIRAGGP